MVQVEYVVGRLRWQLGLERIALFAIRGAFPASLLLAALSIVQLRGVFWFAAIPVALAILVALVRWPSAMQAARAFDRRAHLEDRVATAVELAQREPRGRFDDAQIRDAALYAEKTPRVWLTLDRRAGREAMAAAGTLLAATLCVLLIHNLPRATSPAADGDATATVVAPDGLQQRALPLDDASPILANPTQAPAAPPNLASRVQQEQAEQAALDKLAQGLSNVSAAQAAANDIEQGDFSGARDQLQNLADNADQLSEAAKQQLARGLQQAAAASAQSDKALADREQQAAQALTRSTYDEQRQALRALGDQVQGSGTHSVPSDQLERDIGQLNEQQPQANSTGGQAQQTGPGVGTGVNGDPYSSALQRLNTSGQQVEVPLQLGNGPGVRPPDASDDASSNPQGLSARSVSEVAQSQQIGQVTPEQNLVPSEQRSVVRGYFR